MSNFANSISTFDRENMTISPPPAYDSNGNLLSYTDEMKAKYRDWSIVKSSIKVYIEESASNSMHGYGKLLRYTLMIRCVASDADLRVIANAAKHLGMLEHYRIERGYVENLDGSLEKNYAEIHCDCGIAIMDVDSEIAESVPIYIPAAKRKTIWMELFQAAGYNVTWGKVLNVKKRYL